MAPASLRAKSSERLVEDCDVVEFYHLRRGRTIIWCTGVDDDPYAPR